MTPSKIALFALATAALFVANASAYAAPRAGLGYGYVQTNMGPVETGLDIAKGNLR